MNVPDKENIDFLDEVLGKLPEVKAGKGVWQNIFHQFDVYEHTLVFVRQIKKLTTDRDLIAAGYLHDIGKPVTAQVKTIEGRIMNHKNGQPYNSFKGHEKAGEDMVFSIPPALFQKLGLDQERVARLVGCHFIPMAGIKEMRRASTYEEFLQSFNALDRELDEASVPRDDILLMFLADKLAQGSFCPDKKELMLIRKTLLMNGAADRETRDKLLKKIYRIQKRRRWWKHFFMGH